MLKPQITSGALYPWEPPQAPTSVALLLEHLRIDHPTPTRVFEALIDFAADHVPGTLSAENS